ncbi:bacillithiol biosynthesis protein BshC, partial [Staphylococcus saprophyticus]|uniref:bacillithiol biosynthesis protein BshC n=1 Tax=Staphylococcus saprophyticus TaxID=29385 RepID=UPI0021B4AD8D
MKYHTITPPQPTLSTYYPHKPQLKHPFKLFFKQIDQTTHSNQLIQISTNIIHHYHTSTHIFKPFLNEVFKPYPLLFIHPNNTQLPKLQQPFIQKIIQHHQHLHPSFTNNQ